ncbi:aromatic ring-hydroxylating dioxygenase subunit alpha [Streptomyces sp. AC555_RSS877]|uniref:aromatic ring-hydroxylating dioxygenase subunit alpha n=1 Tax=Streptomyces sp. AC555_RSS877 TaxID=2823688 RepID=UPI001C28034D|nr:aromatic ring-hydroxylating dioxygenase subunit alpha [Streptomyces sp. AC555_RSS877]
MFPLNSWYAAAWDTELGRSLLPRTICERPLVLYRTTSGKAVALADACWHRLVPLSMGELHGDDVVCGYHGIAYGPNGRCTRMPAQETLNPSAAVASYPVVERHRFVWVWLGDPAAADPELVPDLHWNDDPQWAGDGESITVDCDYRLVLDNLMDLTHEQFLHADSLASDELSESEPEVAHDDHSVTLTRWMRGIEAPPFLGMQLRRKNPAHDGPVDRWQVIRYTAPSTITIDVGVAPTGTGAPEGDRSAGVNGRVLNTVTPATAGTCHYFWAFTRNYHLHDQSLTTLLRQSVSRVFGQDTEMLNAQQRAIEANPGHEFYNLNIDVGGMWVRRIVDAQIAREQGRDRTPPSRLAAVASTTRETA